MSRNGNFLYSIPTEVILCENCVISNQPPSRDLEFTHDINNIRKVVKFDSKNICSARRLSEIKQKIYWQKWEEKLRNLSKKFANHPKFDLENFLAINLETFKKSKMEVYCMRYYENSIRNRSVTSHSKTVALNLVQNARLVLTVNIIQLMIKPITCSIGQLT
jgi:hypothetical protein